MSEFDGNQPLNDNNVPVSGDAGAQSAPDSVRNTEQASSGGTSASNMEYIEYLEQRRREAAAREAAARQAKQTASAPMQTAASENAAIEQSEANASEQPDVDLMQLAVAQRPARKALGKTGRRLLKIGLGAAALVLAGVLSVTVYRAFFEKSAYSKTHPDFSLNEVQTPRTDTTVKGAGELLTPAQAAAKVRPSIVSVITTDSINDGQESGQGSGIIVDADGYIVTNSHVIGDSKKYDVSVVMSDGTSYDAEVLGYDTRSDLAVLKINAKGLTACELGDSTQLVLGDYVLAIGNPGGVQFAGSVTYGIVSGVDRIIDTSDTESTSAMRYIQTDAAINPGNSGGALVNMYGQVIGVNTSKISATGYEGMGFAVPSATVKTVITDLIDYGYVQGRVKLGITCRVISSAIESEQIPAGLQIVEIQSESDLNGKAKSDDIITHCDGKRIQSLSQLQDIIFAKKPGNTVELTLYRPYAGGSDNSYSVKVRLLEDTGSKEETSSSEGKGGSNEDDNGGSGFSDFFDNFGGGKKY